MYHVGYVADVIAVITFITRDLVSQFFAFRDVL